jgi:hypothetical protein
MSFENHFLLHEYYGCFLSHFHKGFPVSILKLFVSILNGLVAEGYEVLYMMKKIEFLKCNVGLGDFLISDKKTIFGVKFFFSFSVNFDGFYSC